MSFHQNNAGALLPAQAVGAANARSVPAAEAAASSSTDESDVRPVVTGWLAVSSDVADECRLFLQTPDVASALRQ
jgi:hypothetical protein